MTRSDVAVILDAGRIRRVFTGAIIMYRAAVVLALPLLLAVALDAGAALPIHAAGASGNSVELGLLYDPATGNLSTKHTGDFLLSTLEIVSTSCF